MAANEMQHSHQIRLTFCDQPNGVCDYVDGAQYESHLWIK